MPAPGYRGSPLGNAFLLMVIGIICFSFLRFPFVAIASAETPTEHTGNASATSPKVSQLLQLLADPQVQTWLHDNAGAAKASGQIPSTADSDSTTGSTSDYLAGRLAVIHQHLQELWLAIPAFPNALADTGHVLARELAAHSAGQILALLLAFIALGIAVEWAMRRLWRSVRQWLIDFEPRRESDRLLIVLIRLLYGASIVFAFAVGSTGAFLMFNWPPLLRQIILSYLLAGLSLRLALVLCRFLLAPGAEKFRLLPVPTSTAWFWYHRIATFVCWLAFGWATIVVLRTLDLDLASRQLIAYTLGIGLLVIAIETSWRRPAQVTNDRVVASTQQHLLPHIGYKAVAWLLTAYFVLLWLLWVASAYPSLWTLTIFFALPISIRLARCVVHHLLRPTDHEAEIGLSAGPRSIAAVCLERGLQTILVVCAALLLAKAWHVDFVALASQDTVQTRLARGIVNAVIILLVGDFIWHVAKSIIDRQTSHAAANASTATDEEARRHQRLRTLLPILRNILFITLLIVVVLMALSALGVQIGPLIAGAGVVGVAIGFGAQTLVKDIISGMFYLLDDAFRIGEYIQSGNYKGTVESFSLRSVKLRHQRGPLYTVPFGVLGAIQNMSRDWVIDKLSINVTYDTDLDKVRKLIKDIGKQLADTPEFSHHILQPLKMQGVEQFGDFAIQIRMKMMTKPGEQFIIRRKAYAMIKQAFDDNGIKFAKPTVQVAGGDSAAVAAHEAIKAKAQSAD